MLTMTESDIGEGEDGLKMYKERRTGQSESGFDIYRIGNKSPIFKIIVLKQANYLIGI